MNPTLINSLKKMAPYALLVLVIALAYANALGNGFLYDDDFLIIRNRFLSSWSFLGDIFSSSTTAGSGGTDSFYRPLQILVYLVLRQSFGLQPFAFHAFNILLHMANAGLLYRLGRKLNFNRSAVLIACLLWALHPMHTEAVTYINSASDQLYSFFCLLGCVVLLPDFSSSKMALASLLFLLALLSKETAILFPLLASTLLFAFKKFNRSAFLRWWPLGLVAGVYLWVHFFVLKLEADALSSQTILNQNFAARLFTFVGTLPDYVGILLWPTHLHMERNVTIYLTPFALPVALGAMLLGAALFVIMRAGEELRYLRWGILWFFCAHALHTGLIVPMNAPLGEHWLYLPSAGLFLGFAQQVAEFVKSQQKAISVSPIGGGILLLATMVLGLLTANQNEKWKDEPTFYSYLISEGTRSERVYNNLGYTYLQQQRYDDAIALLKAAIAIKSDYTRALVNLAAAYMARHGAGDAAQAQQAIEKVLVLTPNDVESLTNYARILLDRGGEENAHKAFSSLERAVALEPGYAEAYGLLIPLAGKVGNPQKLDYYIRQQKVLNLH